jgi:hypothetical protein
MKKALAMILAVAALALLFSTCKKEADPTTVDECIDSFMSNVNSNHSAVYKDLDSDSSYYNQAKTPSYWDTYFPAGQTYTLSGKTEVGSTVSGTLSSATLYSGGILFTFTMGEDSDDNAVISKIWKSGNTYIYQ